MSGVTLRPSPVRALSDYQRDWKAVIPPLRKNRFIVEDPESRSIHGDAPKDFIRIHEYVPGQIGHPRNWTGYIAKVGYKHYPNESITEQMITRIGQLSGLKIADSMLRIVAGQVRFLSKFFLARRYESLVHGIQIFKSHLKDDDFVEEISIRKAEREFYSFQTVCAAIRDSFSGQYDELMEGFVEMLAFDAFVGNNDRHPLNWGVIVPVSSRRKPSFSPVFDTARALFWNVSEVKIGRMLNDQQSLGAYINKSIPQIGWDGRTIKSHLDLTDLICRAHPEFKPCFQKFVSSEILRDIERMLEAEFSYLMTSNRRHLVVKCLTLRQEQIARLSA